MDSNTHIRDNLDNLDTNGTMSDFFPLNVSLVRKNLNTKVPNLIPYFNLICNVLIFLIMSIIGIIILSVLNDAVSIMSSGKTVMVDLNLIIPEIKNTLGMLTRLCEHPEFEPYCGLSNHSRIIYEY